MVRLHFLWVIFYLVSGNLLQTLSAQKSDLSSGSRPNVLTGHITDVEGQPLEGAMIFISELNKSCIANAKGEYKLTNLPNRELILEVRSLGHTSQLKKITIPFNERTIDFGLVASPIEAEEIVVSGIKQSTQHENAVKIDVLSLDGHDLLTTPNFSEILTRIPGVDMISKGIGVSKPVIRGLSMNDILILSNGVRFENYQYSSHHPLGIDEYGTQRVEVIKGPASLLYGSDAMGGVLNFIKEKPAPQHQLLGDYQLQLFSNSLGINSSLGLKGAGEHFLGGLRLSQKSHADYLQGGGAFLPNSRFQEKSLKLTTGYNSPIGSFRLYYDYNQQHLGLVEEEAIEALTVRGRDNELVYQQLKTQLLSSQNSIYIGPSKMDLNVAYQRTNLAHLAAPDLYELEMQLATLTYEAKVHLPSSLHSAYILGIQGLYQDNSNQHERAVVLLPNATIANNSGFAFFQQVFGPLQIQTGLRYDLKTMQTQSVGIPSETENYRAGLNKNYDSFSGSFGFTYHPVDELYIRSNLATAFRTPNLAELTSNGPHEVIFEKGDETLQPEKSVELDLSAHWHKKYLTLDLAGFYNKVDRFIHSFPTGEYTLARLPIYRYRQRDSKLYGGEAGLHVHPVFIPWLHAESSYAWVIARQNNGDYLPFIPAAKLNLELKGEWNKLHIFRDVYAKIHAQYAFTQNRPAPEETMTSAYSLFDVGVGATTNLFNQAFVWSLTLNNVMDLKYIDHLSTLKEVGGFNPGRNLILMVKIPFSLN